MKKTYFDEWQTKKICKDSICNIAIVKQEIENYIQDYPEDYSMKSYYANILIRSNELEEAIKEINNVEFLVSIDSKYQKNSEKNNILYKDIIKDKLKYYMYTNQYHEFIKLYLATNIDEKLDHIYYYVLKQLNLVKINDLDCNSYLRKQILNYSFEEFLDHIQKHCSTYDDIENPNMCIFAPDFPIDNIINELTKYLLISSKINSGYLDNTYYFKYDNCGTVKGQMVDYFEVVCFKDTNDLITMCPEENCECEPVDLNYLKDKNCLSKVRRISQIDKFNKKYNL